MICQLLHADAFKEPLKSIKSDLRDLGNALKKWIIKSRDFLLNLGMIVSK